MLQQFFSGLYHEFMAGRLRVEMPVAEAELIDDLVKRNAGSQPSPQRGGSPFGNPFRLDELAYHWPLEARGIGAL